jgi:hypothetical protein
LDLSNQFGFFGPISISRANLDFSSLIVFIEPIWNFRTNLDLSSQFRFFRPIKNCHFRANFLFLEPIEKVPSSSQFRFFRANRKNTIFEPILIFFVRVHTRTVIRATFGPICKNFRPKVSDKILGPI